MAITLVTGCDGNAGATSCTLNLTTGVTYQPDDLLVAITVNKTASQSPNAPAASGGFSWVKRAEQTLTGGDPVTVAFWTKFVGTDAPGATYNFGGVTSDVVGVDGGVFRGVDTTTPMDVTPVVATNTTAQSPTHSGLTSSTADAAIVALHGYGNDGTWTSITSVNLGGFAIVEQDSYTTGSDGGQAIAWETQPTAGGSTGTVTFTRSANTGNSVMIVAALRPAATDTPATGTASLTLAASGVSAAAATGTAALALTATGTAAVQGTPAAGTASLSLTASGTARAVAAGSASLSLSASGTARAAATGSASLALTASGAASAPAAGAATLSLAATGAARAPATGTAALGITATGNTTAPATGVAALVITATGTATQPGTTGSASLSLTASGAARASGAGSAGLTITATGSTRAAAAGSGAVVLTVTGTTRAPATATGSLQLVAAGELAARAAATAALALEAIGTGTDPAALPAATIIAAGPDPARFVATPVGPLVSAPARASHTATADPADRKATP